jgi:hypothetical protein
MTSITTTTTTVRNGFDSKDEFKKSLEDIDLYSSGKPDFFKYSSYIYLDIRKSNYVENNEIKSHLRTIYKGIDCIRDEGWMFNTWQQNEQRDMIPALLALYDLVEGFNWSSYAQRSNYAWM